MSEGYISIKTEKELLCVLCVFKAKQRGYNKKMAVLRFENYAIRQ